MKKLFYIFIFFLIYFSYAQKEFKKHNQKDYFNYETCHDHEIGKYQKREEFRHCHKEFKEHRFIIYDELHKVDKTKI